MEHGAKECVEEQSRRETTIAVGVQSAACIDTEITATNTKEEPELVELVKSEPGLLAKEEVVEDGWRDMDRQPCLQATYKPAITTSMNVVAGGVVQDDGLNIKEEWADTDLDIGPTVLQHMDTRCRPVQVSRKWTPEESSPIPSAYMALIEAASDQSGTDDDAPQPGPSTARVRRPSSDDAEMLDLENILTSDKIQYTYFG